MEKLKKVNQEFRVVHRLYIENWEHGKQEQGN